MKRILSAIIVALVLLGTVTAFAAGTQTDPLISQAYAQGAYRDELIALIEEEIAKDTMLKIRLEALEEQVGFSFSPSFVNEKLAVRDEVTLLPGSSFLLSSGTAAVLFTDGAVVDVTTGEEVSSGTILKHNHRYFCAEDTAATVLTTTAGSSLIDGYYKIVSNPVTDFVERLYVEILERPSDDYGLSQWVSRVISREISASDVAYEFIFCDEITAKNHSDAQFVEILYRSMMGRASDSSGKAYWVDKLSSGTTRKAVFEHFVNSEEYGAICSEYGLIPDLNSPVPAGIRIFVTRLYVECLERQPDLYGRDAWMRRIHTGAYTGPQVATEFVFCEEINNRNLSNEAFVEMLYRTMLGRNAETQGKTAWTNRLDSGWSRQRIYESFVNSQEFTEICRTLGVRR